MARAAAVASSPEAWDCSETAVAMLERLLSTLVTPFTMRPIADSRRFNTSRPSKETFSAPVHHVHDGIQC